MATDVECLALQAARYDRTVDQLVEVPRPECHWCTGFGQCGLRIGPRPGQVDAHFLGLRAGALGVEEDTGAVEQRTISLDPARGHVQFACPDAVADGQAVRIRRLDAPAVLGDFADPASATVCILGPQTFDVCGKIPDQIGPRGPRGHRQIELVAGNRPARSDIYVLVVTLGKTQFVPYGTAFIGRKGNGNHPESERSGGACPYAEAA